MGVILHWGKGKCFLSNPRFCILWVTLSAQLEKQNCPGKDRSVGKWKTAQAYRSRSSAKHCWPGGVTAHEQNGSRIEEGLGSGPHFSPTPLSSIFLWTVRLVPCWHHFFLTFWKQNLVQSVVLGWGFFLTVLNDLLSLIWSNVKFLIMEHLHALIPKSKHVFPLEITFIFYVQIMILLGA